MIDTSKDGGPAFPQTFMLEGDQVHCFGISIRDYFAAKAMQGLLANPNVIGYNPNTGWALVNCDTKDIAAFARMQADDMILERAK